MGKHHGPGKHTAHGGGFLPADADRGQRRAARKAWRAAAAGLVAQDVDREAAAKRAEVEARKAEYRARTPKGGEKRPWAGRTGAPLRVRQHRATTANLSFAYPFLADGGLGSAGDLHRAGLPFRGVVLLLRVRPLQPATPAWCRTPTC